MSFTESHIDILKCFECKEPHNVRSTSCRDYVIDVILGIGSVNKI